MNIENAAQICESQGAVLLSYQPPRLAMLALTSGEQIMISIGTASAKVYRRNSLFGWFLPKCCVSKPLVAWDQRFAGFDKFHRDVFRSMILSGLLSLVSRFKSIDELCFEWPIMKNPMEVASLEFYKRFISNKPQ